MKGQIQKLSKCILYSYCIQLTEYRLQAEKTSVEESRFNVYKGGGTAVKKTHTHIYIYTGTTEDMRYTHTTGHTCRIV